MDFSSKLVFAVIAEGLFLTFVAMGVWFLINRRKLRKQNLLLIRRGNEVATLRQRLELTHEHLQTANEQIKQLQTSHHRARDQQQLRNYQQRVSNLEKFKELYFELEKRINTEINTEEVELYKRRAQELEVVETRLQGELAAYRLRVEELETRQSEAAAHGAVRIKEVEEVNNRLRQSENEIRRLRQECETIGLQYEELAMKSLAMAGERDDLTDAEKSQLEALRQALEENAAELTRKQAECEMLENYYLELEGSADLDKAAEQMQQSQIERNALQEQRRDLNNQVEVAAGQELAEDLAKLRLTLADKEASLDEIRNDYREIKEQFLQVAEAEGELRSDNEALRYECEKLREEVRELNAAYQDQAAQQAELEKLRNEYNTMEARYLALVEKTQH